jgi:hypothetical protein
MDTQIIIDLTIHEDFKKCHLTLMGVFMEPRKAYFFFVHLKDILLLNILILFCKKLGPGRLSN